MNHIIFKNSCIRDIAPHSMSLWSRFKAFFQGKKKTFFTRKNVHALGFAISYYLHKKYNLSSNILIATDTRESRHWIQHQLQNCFRDLGHHVFNAGIAPTPFVAKSLKDYHLNNKPFFQLGIVITASHNPDTYNGFKIMTPYGYLTEQDEQEISDIFYQFRSDSKQYLEYSNSHLSLTRFIQPFQITPFYIAHITPLLKHLPSYKHIKIVLDCAHGATYTIAPQIFQHFGIETIVINNTPDGRNINKDAGCINPSLLGKTVKEHNAQWGCAFDGDGDRIIIVNDQGTIFDGDDISIILSQHPLFKKQTTVVGTIMSNQATENYFNTASKNFIRTAVGERNIITALSKHQAQLGAESCGHITIMQHAYCSDGIFAALLFFDTLQINHTYVLPQKLPQIHTTIPLTKQSLDKNTIETVTNTWIETLKPGRIIARKSNTEPVLRITIEHPNKQTAHQILTEVEQEFKEHIK